MSECHNPYVVQSELTPDAQYGLQLDIVNTFPNHMRAMFNKGKGSFWVPQEKALEEAAWLQMHLNDRHFVMVDFDGLDEHHWRTLPLKPNIVSFNPNNGNHQCYWLLKDPVHCHKEAKKGKAYKYLKLLEKAIDEKYQGDKHFSRAICKNLFHPRWETDWIHDRRHTLAEIHKGLELDLREVSGYQPKPSTSKAYRKAKSGNGKRNTTMFDNVRYRAYREVSKYKSMDGSTYEDWLDVVTEWCARENVWDDAEPLPRSAVEATAKQIARFCWYVYNPPKTKKPKMTIEQIKEAQRKSAEITNAKKRGSAEAAIKVAIKQLVADGKKPTKAAVARIVGLSRVSVSKNYSHMFD